MRRLRGAARAERLESTRGQEACRVSTAIDLGAGDLVSDSQAGVVMDLIAGAKVGSLLKRVAEITLGEEDGYGSNGGISADFVWDARVLPWVDDAEERLRLAMGAALGFKTAGAEECCGRLCSAWARLPRGFGGGAGAGFEAGVAGDFCGSAAGWKRPGETAGLERRAARWGVPGIPVDAGDAVAFTGWRRSRWDRTRGGDGPVLIECVEVRVGGKGGAPVDPVVQMKDFLLGRKSLHGGMAEERGRPSCARRIAALSK